MGDVADWFAGSSASLGAWSAMELFEIGIARSVGVAITPYLIGSVVHAGVGVAGSEISNIVDREHGRERWNEYYASPMSKISPGKDSILKNILYATATHHVVVKDGLQKLGTVHPLARLWMKNV